MKKLTNNIDFLKATIYLFNFRKSSSYQEEDFLMLYGEDKSKWKLDLEEIKNYISSGKSSTLNTLEIELLNDVFGEVIIPDKDKQEYKNYLKSHLKILSKENKILKQNIKKYGRDNYKFYLMLKYNKININTIHNFLNNTDSVNKKYINRLSTNRWEFSNNRYDTFRKYYISIDDRICYFNIVDNINNFEKTYHGKIQAINEDNYMSFDDLNLALMHYKELGDYHFKEMNKLGANDIKYDIENETMSEYLNRQNKARILARDRVSSIIKNYKRLHLLNKILDEE